MTEQAIGKRAIRAALLGSIALTVFGSGVAIAQTAASDDTEPTKVEEIIVTGSRIASPNMLSAVPVTSVSVEQLTYQGNVSIGDALNELPALRSTYSQGNSTRFIGTAGLNLLDLRGQGIGRTLVLVNGRRHVTSQPGSFNVDTNTISADLLERVDVVTGGNSAVYGSDAVAGVVNFVLKRDFEGVAVRAQGGTSSRSDRDSYFVSLTAGQNFNEDRGNVAVSFEYADAKALFFTERDNQTGALSGRSQFNLQQNTIGEPSTGDGFPDQGFFEGIRNIGISEGGIYTSVCPAAVAPTAANYAAVQARRAVNCTGLRSNANVPTSAELGRTFAFDDNGNLVANPVIADFRPFGSGNSIGGFGSTLRLTGMLAPGTERKSANLLASYEVSELFRPFLEAKFVRVDSLQEGQPTFHNNTFQLSNPFLTAANRALLVSSLAPGATTFTAQRFNVDFGGRGEEHQRDTYRVVVGAEGTFSNDWKYEVAANYGRFETYYETNGNISRTRFANSINAVSAANGSIVCGINNDANPANDDPSCVPVNLFGFGAPSQEALDYFLVTSSREQEAEQLVFTGFLSGDSAQWFELPGGPVGFAIGAEFRRETAYSAFDEFTASGGTFLNAIAAFDPPAAEVTEGFAELRIPLLAELDFAKELTVEASGRVSDYGGTTGTVFAYNVGGVYAPIDDLRLRVGYARSVRAPTLANLYSAGSQTFQNNLQDPCSANNINNNPNRVANCAAAGVPTTETVNGVVVPWTNIQTSGVRGINGGNPNLIEETGTSLTVGFVATPSFVEGLTVSLDYYSIEIEDVINTLTGQTIINQCYDSSTGINNPFCAAVFRNPDGTFAGQSGRLVGGNTITFPVTGDAFLAGPFNYARQETSGVDVDVSYRTSLFDDLDISLRSIVSYIIKRDEYRDVVDPNFRTQLKGDLGDPVWAATFNADLTWNGFDLNYSNRYVGKQTIAAWATQNSVDGRPPTNPDSLPVKYYKEVLYHDLRVGYTFENELRFYVGVDNLMDRLPQYGTLGTNGNDSIYDNIGRFFYAGASYKF